jgi:hypothetical protein
VTFLGRDGKNPPPEKTLWWAGKNPLAQKKPSSLEKTYPQKKL